MGIINYFLLKKIFLGCDILFQYNAKKAKSFFRLSPRQNDVELAEDEKTELIPK